MLTREQIAIYRKLLLDTRFDENRAAAPTVIHELCDMALSAEEAIRDAKRYRWLKTKRPQPMWSAIPLEVQIKYADTPTDENMIDAAIDAAIAESDEEKKR